ncbi:MAG: RtcB family protein [Mariniblastus sp.]
MSEKERLIRKWVSHRLDIEVERSLLNLRRAPDVQHLSVMPDVHLAKEVCIGTVLATNSVVYPMAVGGDIGCGILAIKLDVEADLFANETRAAQLLSGLYRTIPTNRHSSETMLHSIGDNLNEWALSDPSLEKIKSRDAKVQLGTLGRGNHFLEFQSDPNGALWLMIHSGSRAIGQSITRYHLDRAAERIAAKLNRTAPVLIGLDTSKQEGKSYLNDMQWARQYASENRLAMMRVTIDLLRSKWNVRADHDSLIHTDHNHVQFETHFGNSFLVHRKGAQRLAPSQFGIVPGSMGTCSFLVSGRGNVLALQSCSHGAGRRLSRTEAKKKITSKRFEAQMKHVWFDRRKSNRLRDESPEAYKDIREVMRSQRDLVRIVSEQNPVLNFKGG